MHVVTVVVSQTEANHWLHSLENGDDEIAGDWLMTDEDFQEKNEMSKDMGNNSDDEEA